MLDGLRVLVVEDEFLIAEIIGEGGGAVIGPCSTISQARQLIRAERAHAAILDVDLEDGDLTSVLEALRAKVLPVLVYAGGELAPRLRERHPDLAVTDKPLQTGRLLLECKRRTRQHSSGAARHTHAG